MGWHTTILSCALCVSCGVPLVGCPASPLPFTQNESSRQDSGVVDTADGGVGYDDDAGPQACAQLAPVLALFESSCVACHRPGGEYPDLTRAAVTSTLVGAVSATNASELLVVPSDPSRSWLWRKINGTFDDDSALMPLGAGVPIDGIGVVQEWILAGASTLCDAPPPPTAQPYDPNTLDQDALFTCAPNAPASASPARMRRIGQREWVHAIGHANDGSPSSDAIANNPLFGDARAPYSTFSDSVSIDAATLELFLLLLPEAGEMWQQRDVVGHRTQNVYDDPNIRCMFGDATPSDACIDAYLDSFFAHGVFFRPPSADERSRLRDLVIATVASENGDVALRPLSLNHVGQAAWLMTGALFRSEMGAGAPDAAGRRRLSDHELASALGALLSTHPPGSTLPSVGTNLADFQTPQQGWLSAITRAADDGTISDPTVMRALIASYATITDVNRPDLDIENFDMRTIDARGEYGLSPRIRDFFREYFGTTAANTAFKDTPTSSTRFADEATANPLFDPTTLAYQTLQEGAPRVEATFVTLLDDTIARHYVEADSGNGDLFERLLTTRQWRLPSNLSASNDVACTQDSQCAADPTYTRCGGNGFCSSSVATRFTPMNRIFNVGNIANTQAGRWVSLPADERAGILTHPGWLTAHGNAFEDDASLVRRGKWIREQLFCQTVPGLERVQVQAQLGGRGPDLSARERVAAATEQGPHAATCLGCHKLMNPLGNAFEIYNHAGFMRDSDHGGAPDGHTAVDNAPDPALNHAYTNAIDLMEALAHSNYTRRCFVRHAFRYFAGRNETALDACTLTQMEAAFAGGSFTQLLTAFATSETFLYRTDANTDDGAGVTP